MRDGVQGLLVFIFCLMVLGCNKAPSAPNASLNLQINTHKVAAIRIPVDTESLIFPIFVPVNTDESGMTFSVKSTHSDFHIELFDPDNKRVASSSSGKGYFIPSRTFPPEARVNQWGFPRIVDPKPGEWTVKFLKTDRDSKKNVDLQLSIGLVPKYSAWINAYETRIQVGQPTIIQMSLSTHGVENSIEGHTIEVFNKINEKIDSLTVSNNMVRSDGVRINVTDQSYLAQYIPKKSGIHTFKAEFTGEINGKPSTKKIEHVISVVDSKLSITGLSMTPVDSSMGMTNVDISVSVLAQTATFLVVRVTYLRNGETIDTLRNKEMRAGERANFSFPITDITQQEFDARSILIERIELVDFDVESSAKLMLSMPINKTVSRNAEDIKPEGKGEFDTLGSTAPDNRDVLH
jgi:hypothetical protein